MTFLFWNLHNRPIYEQVAAAAVEHDADVVMLTEVSDNPITTLLALNNTISNRLFELVPAIDESLPQIFVRFRSEWVTALRDTSRQRIVSISLPGLQEIILAVVHLESKMYHSNSGARTSIARDLAIAIGEVEEQRGHARTIAVGDFNMAPFEDGLMHVDALNAVMDAQIAARKPRKMRDKSYAYFYNPMWNLLGDQRGVPGSYYYRPNSYRSDYWHLFDQVLLRPDIAKHFGGEVAILESIAGTSLLKKGVPNKTAASDHLPLLFKIDFQTDGSHN